MAETPSHHPLSILGAGPTGLGAALRMTQTGETPHIFEASHVPGGLARTITGERGFRWELGGHVTFSHFEAFDGLIAECLGDHLTNITRESWVATHGVWIPYPFQNNLRYLPNHEREACLVGLEQAQRRAAERFGSLQRAVAEARTLDDVIDRVFGPGIGRVFMTPYNTKVWATSPSGLGARWLGERVALVDAARARRNVEQSIDDFGWGPNNTFRFPIEGTGALYEAMAARLEGSIRYQTRLVGIDPEAHTLRFDTPTGPVETTYDTLVSTIPVNRLIGMARGVPPNVLHAAGSLRFASGDFVGIGVRRPCPSSTSWMYFPERHLPFYRVTYLSNYSPAFAPDGHYSMLCEISSEAGSPPGRREDVIASVIAGLERVGLLGSPEGGSPGDIVTTWHARVTHSYPVPTPDRDEHLSVILPWLESRGIYSRGRFGLWKYEVANTDHSVMQGFEVADRILHGTPETVTGIRYDNGLTHTRPETAGSGEKRLSRDRGC